MNRKIILAGLTLGVLSIIFGAFGAHALKNGLTDNQLITFETGVRYQMYHSLFLLFVACVDGISVQTKNKVFYLVIIGVLFFSGSLYFLATNSITVIDFSFLGPITPIGGLLLIASWMFLIFNFLKLER